MDFPLKEHIPIASITTFGIGGVARYVSEVQSVPELQAALSFAKEQNIPFYILGSGSNTVGLSETFPGIIIQYKKSGISIEKKIGEHYHVTANANTNWDELVGAVVEERLWGIENLSFIPGTCGAAPVQNIGAYGQELSDTIYEVTALHTPSLTLQTIKKDDCHFGYRTSRFKKNNDYVILSITLSLSTNPAPNTNYADVQQYFSSKSDPSLREMRNAIIAIRKKKLPDPKHIKNAGSFFKNPTISKKQFEMLQHAHPTITGYAQKDDRYKLSAASVIDTVCHMKGFAVGNVQVSPNHALILTNPAGTGTREQLQELIEKIIACVQQHTDITLEPEVNIL